MVTVQSSLHLVKSGASPRSTILASSTPMATEDKMASGVASTDSKVGSSGSTARKVSESDSIGPIETSSNEGKSTKDKSEAASHEDNGLGHSSLAAQVPPRGGGYYPGYPSGSSSVSGSVISGLPYDAAAGAFVQPASTAVFPATAQSSPFGVSSVDNTPLSPPRSNSMTSVPPASPLFPRVNNGVMEGNAAGLQAHQVTPQSPGLPYSVSLGSTGPYPSYAGAARMVSQASSSSDDGNWDRNSQNMSAYASSPAMMYGMMGRAGMGGRTYSVDSDAMLPPAALDPLDQGNPAYSPYSTGHPSSPAGSMFTHQQPWTYPGPLPDMYSTPGSPLQPRPTVHQQAMHMYTGGMMGGMRPMGSPYGHHFYPSSSPGPPIQTTGSNKGPDGANLFIFHIPNHFTNVDMYHLFCPYGNLLSVRIMVEKDTGRSRGFGFVSYDNPESAALAIKELNGYAIGNKRLKVQHKQIRQRDLQDRDGGMGRFGEGSPENGFSSSLPPPGPGVQSAAWYDRREPGDEIEVPPPSDEANMGASTEIAGAEDKARESAEENGVDTDSPLVCLGSLQSALPEVAGAAANE